MRGAVKKSSQVLPMTKSDLASVADDIKEKGLGYLDEKDDKGNTLWHRLPFAQEVKKRFQKLLSKHSDTNSELIDEFVKYLKEASFIASEKITLCDIYDLGFLSRLAMKCKDDEITNWAIKNLILEIANTQSIEELENLTSGSTRLDLRFMNDDRSGFDFSEIKKLESCTFIASKIVEFNLPMSRASKRKLIVKINSQKNIVDVTKAINDGLMELEVKNLNFVNSVKNLSLQSSISIDEDIDINFADSQGRTALHWAAKNKNYGLVRFLKEKGAHTWIKDNEGKTPLDHAKSRYFWQARNNDLVDFLTPISPISQPTLTVWQRIYQFFVGAPLENKGAVVIDHSYPKEYKEYLLELYNKSNFKQPKDEIKDFNGLLLLAQSFKLNVTDYLRRLQLECSTALKITSQSTVTNTDRKISSNLVGGSNEKFTKY